MLLELGLSLSDNNNVIEIATNSLGKHDKLYDYFAQFLKQLDQKISLLNIPHEEHKILLLNLMPFYLSTSRMDKIARGLYFENLETILNGYSAVVFLLRNIDWLLRSDVFKHALHENKIISETWALDIRCFGAKIQANGNIKDIVLSREPFRKILNIEQNRIYKSLIFETNSYIGHFALKSSHVRTHYNLNEFIKRDNVWEFLFSTFNQIIEGFESLLLIGVGMEYGVIQRMGEHLKTILGDRIYIDFEYKPATASVNEISADWSNRYDKAIVIGDIINSGNTLDPWIKELQKKNKNAKSISIFVIAAMINSPETIAGLPVHAGVVIRRTYYPSDPQLCNLCVISQPLISVHKVEDFYRIAPGQLTPFDFWEMVTDSNAIKKNVLDPQGRLFAYRIDTSKIIKRYGHWLRNVIRYKFAEKLPNYKPDVICTVNEPTGISFGGLVRDALGVQRLVYIDRSELERITPTGGLPDNSPNPFQESNSIYVVDDGMNYGKTMYQLVNYCRAAGKVPIGGMVLDSRLEDSEIKNIRSQMANNHLIALYKWPSRTKAL